MSPAKNVVLEYVNAFNRGDLDALSRLFTPDAQIWGVLGFGTVSQVLPIWKDLMECLQVKLEVESMIAEGGTVAVRYAESGTSVKPFRGAGPTGRSYQITAMEWFEIKDNLIHRRWGARDSAAQSRQLGFTE